MLINFNSTVKKEHEDFVSNLNGTTLENNYHLVSIPILLNTCMSIWKINLFQVGIKNIKWNIWMNFITVVVPYIITITILNEYIKEINFLIITLLIVGFVNSSLLSSSSRLCHCLWSFKDGHSNSIQAVLLFVSQMRGLVLLSSGIAILAVDMNIFPRKFAKTEFYGFGPMDLGVAMFTLLSGMVHGTGTKYQMKKKIKTVLIMAALGVIRVLFVKGIKYQEHETEYGVHWNFFWTFACINIVAIGMSSLKRTSFYVLIMILIVGISQHFWLYNDKYGFEQFCLDNEVNRSGFLVANKEGLISIPGYVLLWGIGVLLGNILYRPHILIPSLICWSVFAPFIVNIMELKVSRRAANLGYVLWSSSTFCWMLLLWIFSDIILNWLENRANYITTKGIPDIWCLVNRRGLLHFLFANVLTGIINSFINTIKMESSLSLFVLILYTAITVAVIQLMEFFGNRNKVF